MNFQQDIIRSVGDLFNIASSWVERYFNHDRGYSSTWYRGHAQAWPLLPGVLRPDFLESIRQMEIPQSPLKIERNMLWHFIQKCSSFFTPRNNVDLYFLAQHYGIPTRLLDWTTSPLCALFFAVGDRNNTNDGFLYAMNPREIDWTGVYFQTFAPCISENIAYFFGNSTAEPPISHLPNNCTGLLPFLPERIDPRIANQDSQFLFFPPSQDECIRGFFNTFPEENNLRNVYVQFGNNKTGYERFDSVVYRYRIPGENKPVIRRELLTLGFVRGHFFPDPENIAREIREAYILPPQNSTH